MEHVDDRSVDDLLSFINGGDGGTFIALLLFVYLVINRCTEVAKFCHADSKAGRTSKNKKKNRKRKEQQKSAPAAAASSNNVTEIQTKVNTTMSKHLLYCISFC